MESIPLYQVDAFTDKIFTGNPAAICLFTETQRETQDSLLLAIAAEMNLSETAFVFPHKGATEKKDDELVYQLRWFTPKVEVSLCGHATIGTAAVLFKNHGAKIKLIRFHTLSGEIVVEKDGDACVMYLPTFETIPFEEAKLNFPEIHDLLKAVVGDHPIHKINYVPSRKRILVQLEDSVGRSGLESLSPDPSKLTSIHNGSLASSVTVTVLGDGQNYDFLSRHFSPWIGINEDPVTGSAHSYIAPYWSKILNKSTFSARQCSPRGGDLRITYLEEKQLIRVEAKYAMVFEGKLFLPPKA